MDSPAMVAVKLVVVEAGVSLKSVISATGVQRLQK